MAKTKKEYGNDSIIKHEEREKVRNHISTWTGTSDKQGCFHLLNEIIANSIDEFKAGYGTEIIVKKYEDGSYSVQDFGRGLPLDYNKKSKEWNYVLVLETLFASGKYDEGDVSFYENSQGLNGVGLTVTQYSSSHFEVTSIRDGYEYNIKYKSGNRATDLNKKKTKSKKNGTFVHWLPDLEIFDEIDIDDEEIINYLNAQAIVNGGVKLIYESPTLDEQYSVIYPEGILGRVKELVGENYFIEPLLWTTNTSGKDRADKPEYKLNVNIALAFSNKVQHRQFFHNSSDLIYGGSPQKALEQASVEAIDKYIKKTGKYTKTDQPISFEDIAESLVFISSCFQTPAKTIAFEGQTKFAISNKYVRDFMADFIKEQFEKLSISAPEEMDKIANQILINSRSRYEAETQRKLNKQKRTAKSNLLDRIPDFTDCRSKNTDEREIFFAEGKSAKGSLLTARFPEFQAIYPLRGKFLNCLKASPNEILKSEIVTNIIKILGCGMNLEVKGKNKAGNFDISKLQYGKILLASDADDDGAHINCLLITLLHRLCPELIKQGYVYIVKMPLYETYRKEKGKEIFEYAYSDKELTSMLNKYGDKLKVQRNKGLGEMSSDVMHDVAMNKETRKLIRVTISDAKKAAAMLELFMDKEVPPRRKFIEENSYRFIDEARN